MRGTGSRGGGGREAAFWGSLPLKGDEGKARVPLCRLGRGGTHRRMTAGSSGPALGEAEKLSPGLELEEGRGGVGVSLGSGPGPPRGGAEQRGAKGVPPRSRCPAPLPPPARVRAESFPLPRRGLAFFLGKARFEVVLV